MSSGRKRDEREHHRGCLLLSLIILIGNIAVTGYRTIEADRPKGVSHRPAPSPYGFAPGPGTSAAVDASGKAPLRIRQKYLLGYRVDINRADAAELSGIPGISDATADAILAERNRTGGFRHPGELLRVRGIKEKRLKKILPFLSGFHNN